ncbi:MAG: 4'-phosphopantetheinyl transferase superfamily protein [Gammaproteobacteria bacterium]|nr:4'-phosphopantetheinyl transferase superfamily protein [Gammaproteobacteria bacterium]
MSRSLAHSRQWCAAVTAPAALRMGVDLEWIRVRDEPALARWAYAECEWQALMALQPAERRQQFYALWTLKEACAKALGLALLPALRACVFQVSAGHWRGRLPTADRWQAWVFAPRQGLVLAVVCVGEQARDIRPPRAKEWPQPGYAGWQRIAHPLPEDPVRPHPITDP